MTRQKDIGVSYGRFSEPKQSHGSSEERQEKVYRDFCARHDLTPLTEVFMDKGRSGYHDEHRKRGRLGVLIQYAKAGLWDPGTVIVIEAWDRLGRLRPDKQTELVAELLRTGVRIGICRLNDIFCEDDFGTHKWTTLAVFIQLAYQESKQKAERAAASHASRRKAVREGKELRRQADGRASALLTDRVPGWLEVQGGRCRRNPERVAVVRRIFELSKGGLGVPRIVAALTKEKVGSFGGAKAWTRSYISRILNDRRVQGEYQPRTMAGDPDGPPIADYYPRVISEDDWLLSRAGQERRHNKDRLGRVLARSERKRVNLFRGLLTSARDGGGFILHQPKAGRLVLLNTAGHSGTALRTSFPYLVLEEAVLTLLREVNPEEVLPPPGAEARAIDVLKAKLQNVREDIKNLNDDLQGGYSKNLAALLRGKEAEEEDVATRLQAEKAKMVRPVEGAWRDLPSLASLVKTGGDEARLKLRPVLRRVVESAHVLIVRRSSYQICALQLHFAGGSDPRHYLIVNRPAGNGREARWWARSFADAGQSGDFDLRDKTHVGALERALAALPLSLESTDD